MGQDPKTLIAYMKRKNFISLVMAWTFLSISISGLLMYFDLKPDPVKGIHVLFGLILIGFGIFQFISRRHPRVLARIRPTQLALWSFAVAIAHGAGLMLVPIYIGL